MKPSIVLLCLCAVMMSNAAVGDTWIVRPDGTGDAPTIQGGIDMAAPGDTVLLEPGTYAWTQQGTGDGTGLIRIQSAILLLGDGGNPASVVIDAEGQGRCVDATGSYGCELKGVTITGGDKSWGGEQGGGLLCDDQTRVVNCIFRDNTASYGGGIVVPDGGVQIHGCTFVGNSAGLDGGAVYCPVRAELTDCLFKGNDADEGSAIWTDEALDISGCSFEENTATVLHIEYGSPGTLQVRGCEFLGNHNIDIRPQNGVNATIEDCIFYSSYRGIHCAWECVISINNCTFVGQTGEAIHAEWSWISMENSIVAFGAGSPFYCRDLPASPIIACCDFYGNAGGDWVGCTAGYDGVDGNFSACPSFCHMGAGDLQLCDESPCLPGNHPDGYECGVIGAYGQGCSCGPTRTQSATWGAVKSLYK